MDPASNELLRRLRQQLILAQVRLMEIEDERDALATRLADAERLTAEAQTLADAKLAEVAHLEKIRADLQQQFEHLRHVQHLTNEALNETRAQLAARDTTLASAQQQLAHVEAERDSLRQQLSALEARLASTVRESDARLQRLTALESELGTLRASRSWRWTAWLRRLERRFSRNQ